MSCVTGATAIVDCPIPIVYLAGSTPRATAKVSISSAVGGTKKPILSIPIFIVVLLYEKALTTCWASCSILATTILAKNCRLDN